MIKINTLDLAKEKLDAFLSVDKDRPTIRGVLLINAEGKVYKRDAFTNKLLEISVTYPLRVFPFSSESKASDALLRVTDGKPNPPFDPPVIIIGAGRRTE